eukprot:SAG31_NODE_1672_length_7564_cov_10.193704_5_plen_136_part_00
MIRNDNVSTLHWPPGDYSVWPDEAGVAYIIYTSISTHQMTVERLTGDWLARITSILFPTGPDTCCSRRFVVDGDGCVDDWLGSTMNSSGVFGDKGVEAPVMFRRGSTYYAFFDKECCYCPQGSGVVVCKCRCFTG